MRTAIAAISCLFLLILGGMAAGTNNEIEGLPDISDGYLISATEITINENTTFWYSFAPVGMEIQTRMIPMDSNHRYVVLVIEKG